MNKQYEAWGKPTRWLKRLLMREQRGACFDCNVQEFDLNENLQVHRWQDKDGAYSPDNCVLLCRKCHARRHKKVTS